MLPQRIFRVAIAVGQSTPRVAPSARVRASPASSETVELTGKIARVVYANPETLWTVLKLDVRAEDREKIAREVLTSGREIAVVGSIAGVHEGETLRVWGTLVDDTRFGRQLRAQGFQVVLPASASAIERYLASGLVPGIGPTLAKQLVEKFGADTLEVIDKSPDRLLEIKGIGAKKVEHILASWKEHTHIRDVMVFLQGLRITPAFAARIIKPHG